MGNRLSYSAIRLYNECGKKYEYHYIKRLREKTKSGALFFGTAVDRALEAACKDPTSNPENIFDANWMEQDINGVMVKLRACTAVVYAATDFDADLLDKADYNALYAAAEDHVPELLAAQLAEGTSATDPALVEALVKLCAGFKAQRPYREFTIGENTFLNIANWHSLRRKGHLMIQAFRDKVAHKIKKVLRMQHKIELNNGSDSVVGYPDLVCIWEDDQPTVIDFKTSSIEYARDSVRTSAQLSIYCHAENIRRAGFVVFRKQILKNKTKVCSACGSDGTGGRHKSCASTKSDGKRCGAEWIETIRPEVLVQIIVDEIPARTEEIVIENLDATNKAITAGVFPRNFGACQMGYGPCAFKSLCFKNDASDLIEMKEREYGKTPRN